MLTAICSVSATVALAQRRGALDRPLSRWHHDYHLCVVISLHHSDFHNGSFTLPLPGGALHRLSVRLIPQMGWLVFGFTIGPRIACVSPFVGGEKTEEPENSGMKDVTQDANNALCSVAFAVLYFGKCLQ